MFCNCQFYWFWTTLFQGVNRNSHRRCSVRKDVLRNFLEMPEACNFIQKETLAQVLSCEFCEVSKNTFFYRTPPVAASVVMQFSLKIEWSQWYINIYIISNFKEEKSNADYLQKSQYFYYAYQFFIKIKIFNYECLKLACETDRKTLHYNGNFIVLHAFFYKQHQAEIGKKSNKR